MSVLGIVNVVLFVMICVKLGFGKGIMWYLGSLGWSLLFSIIATVACIVIGPLGWATFPVVVAITQFIVTIFRIRKAVDQLQ